MSQSSILGGQFHRACFENVHHQQSCRRQDGTGKTRRPALFQSLGPLRGGMTRGSRARHDLLPYLPPYLPTLGLQQAQSPVTHCACRMSDQDSQTTLPIYRATQGSHCIGYLLTNHGLCRVVKRHSGGGGGCGSRAAQGTDSCGAEQHRRGMYLMMYTRYEGREAKNRSGKQKNNPSPYVLPTYCKSETTRQARRVPRCALADLHGT